MATRQPRVVVGWAGVVVGLLVACSSAGAQPVHPLVRGLLQELHQEGLALLKAGRLEGARRHFSEIVACYTGEASDLLAWEALTFLGEIEVRLGRLDDAISFYEQGLHWISAMEGRLPPREEWQRLSADINLCQHIVQTLMEEGRMARARTFIRRASQAIEARHALEGAHAAELGELAGSDGLLPLIMRLNEAMFLLGACKRDEGRALYREVAGQARESGEPWLQRTALIALLNNWEGATREEDALALAREAELLPAQPSYEAEWQSQAAEIALARASISGYSEDLLIAATGALARLEKLQALGELLSARMWHSGLLAEAGRTNEALAVVESVLQTAREKKYVRLEAMCLFRRAVLKSCACPDAGEDLVRALLVFRTLGLKAIEPSIYRAYGCWLLEQGDYAMAGRVFELAFDFADALGLHPAALGALMSMASLYERTGDRTALEWLWERIDIYIEDHPLMPKRLLKRIEETRAEHQALLAHQAVPPAPVPVVGGAATGAVESAGAAAPPAAAAIPPVALGGASEAKVTEAVAQVPAADRVILQPRHAATRVDRSETARATFLLLNPAPGERSGRVEVAAGGLDVAWADAAGGYTVRLLGATGAGQAGRDLSVAPGGCVYLFMEADPAVVEESRTVGLSWNTLAPVTWDFGFTNDTRSVAVINASLVEHNPFFAIPFHHYVYARTLPALRNIKAHTSWPCRVELADQESGRILALDASGNGRFDDSGDDIYQDANADDWPDISFTAGADVCVLEVLVFPGRDQSMMPGDIDISLYLQEPGGSWELQAVDTLEMEER